MVANTKKQYSVFPKHMKRPIYKEAEQEELQETGELQTLALKSIKPAFTTETSSEFHDLVVCKFTNYIMREGKKISARNVMRAAFAHIKRTQIEKYNTAKTEKEQMEIELDPVIILHRAVENTTPVLELVKLRRGGVHYQVPHPLTWKRARFLSMNWLIQAAKTKERTVHLGTTLGNELMAAAANTGSVVKRKHELHKQCEANRAYAHFRWR
ncbi:28S ribosomal protein S7, mitochondrial isoform X2 [Belonocnema kinseyi]|nr:28S ribosomal protein S7, mitochondrial isoform X2 [Belonocnema kinseyi]